MLAAVLQLRADLFDDGLDLFGIAPRAHHEEVGKRGYIAQIQHANVCCFLRFCGADRSEPRWGGKRKGDRLNRVTALLSDG